MPVKLTLVLSGRTLSRHEFGDDFKRLRIGRNEDCDVQIDNLGVSRVHCEILRKPGFVQLRDLQSGNGTFVNGKKVQAHNLNSGDVISLGKYTLHYEAELSDEQSDPSLTGARDGMMTLAMDAATLARRHREEQGRSRGHLAIPGRPDVILDRALTVIGREPDADVQVSGWFCPRVVAVIVRDEQGFRLLDVSPRGKAVRVNGRHRLDAVLNDNDELELQGTQAVFRRGMPVGARAVM